MKALRAFLLILLVVLVPLRGAFAMETLCAFDPGAVHASGHGEHAATLDSGSHQHHASAAAHHAMDAGDSRHASHEHGGHHGSLNHCNVCSALGGMAGPIAPLLVPAQPPATTAFSRVDAPPARLVADRLERPPRTA